MNYVLKKDLPNLKAGAVFTQRHGVYDVDIDGTGHCFSLFKNTVENNPDWFEPEVWKPNANDRVFTVSSTGEVGDWIFNTNGIFSELYLKSGNCFRTKEAAERAADKIREILKTAERE